MGSKKKKTNKPYHCLGFDFYPGEMAAMCRAIEKSVQFMQNYGKGQQPLLYGHPISRRSTKKQTDRWTPFDL